MAHKRHTDFYLPVLKTLEDLKDHEVNALIAETADLCRLSDEERQERTRKGTQLKFESNIQWAITDLCQGGFIERSSRGVYKIAFDGLLMLEDNPKNPNRDYLEARSQKFKEFRYRKGTRNKSNNEENLFSGLSEEDIETDEKPKIPVEKVTESEIRANAMDLIKKYINLKKAKEALEMNTTEEDGIIRMLHENMVKRLLIDGVGEFEEKLERKGVEGYALLFDHMNSSKGRVYLITKDNRLMDIADSSILIYDRETTEDAPESTDIPQIQDNIKKKKAHAKKLKVTFEDGTVFEGKYAADVFADAIEKIGPMKVQKLGLTVNGFPLVGNTAPDKYQYKVIAGKYYIPVNSATSTKKRLLEQISEALRVKLSVIIK